MFYTQKTFCRFRFSGKFCGIVYVQVFLKIINIPNVIFFPKLWKDETTKQNKTKKIHDNFTGGSSTLRPPPPLDSLLLKFVFHNFYLLIFPFPISSFYCVWIAFSFAFFSDKPFINDSQFFSLQLPPRQARISSDNTKIMQKNTCYYYLLCVFQFTFASFIYYSEAAF